jgi:hypothetical protein
VETTWWKEWFAYLSSTAISWCSCGKTTVVDEWSVIRLSTESCLSESSSPIKQRVQSDMQLGRCHFIVVIYRKGKNVFEWMSRGIVKVIKWFLSVLRIEVSRHFKVIRVLGPWDVPTRMSQRWVSKKEWWETSNIALGQMQTMHKYKWWTKNISRCRWISVYRLILH